MHPSFFTIYRQDGIGEAIDNRRLPAKIRRGVDHAEDPEPGRHAIQITQSTFKATQYGKRSQTCQFIGLLLCDLCPNFTKRSRQRAVWQLRSISRTKLTLSTYTHPRTA